MAHLAGAFARLVIAGRKVHWDWLPLVAAVLTFQSSLIYWWFQWSLREQPVVMAELSVRAVACLLLYMLAVAVLPEDSRGRPNLKEHFERSNRLFFGVYGALVLLTGVMPHANRMLTGRAWEVPWANLIIITLCVVAVFLRRRWLHTLVIIYLLLRLNQDWIGQVISD
jgi:hypothetical protein